MKSSAKTSTYIATILILLVVAAAVWFNQNVRRPAPSAPGYVSGWFACKAHPGWLCKEDGEMKPDPAWKGPREENPRAPKPKLPPGPEG